MGQFDESLWMLTIGFDTSSAVASMQEYAKFLISEKKRAKLSKKNVSTLRSFDIEFEKLRTLKKQIDTTVRVNVISKALNSVLKDIYNDVTTEWDSKLNNRSGRYFSAIHCSQLFKVNNTIMAGVGYIPKLMAATNLKHRKDSGWGFGSSDRDISRITGKRHTSYKKKRIGGQLSYIASRGPLRGQPITGYWYFQEEGFYHIGQSGKKGNFIINPVFSIIETKMKQYEDKAIVIYDREVSKALAGKGRYSAWAGL